MEHLDKLNKNILKMLWKYEVLTVIQIADEMNISEKNVRNRLKEIDAFLNRLNLGKIVRKPSVGVSLICDKYQKGKIENEVILLDQSSILGDERPLYLNILIEILKPRKGDPITLKELSNKLCSSRSLIEREMDKCILWLHKNKIEIEIKRKLGIIINCDGEKYRMAVRHLIYETSEYCTMDKTINDLFNSVSIFEIKRCIIAEEKKWSLSFSKKTFTDIVIYFSVCIGCNTANKYPIFGNTDYHNEIVHYDEYELVKAISRNIENRLNILITNNEMEFIALQLLCFSSSERCSAIEDVENNIDTFIKEVMKVSSIALNVDFGDDRILFDRIKEHVRQTLFRAKYNREISNEMIDYIKREFSHSYKLVPIISILFEHYFHFQISENELGYIILYLRVAAKRRKRSVDLVVVSEQQKSVIEYITSRLQELTVNIRHINTIGIREFRHYELKENEIVLTTEILENIKDCENSIYINPKRLDFDIERIRNQIESYKGQVMIEKIHFDASCYSLFDVDLLFVNGEYNSKEELIRQVINVAKRKGYVTKDYYQSVIEREHKTSTAIGEGVATPHGNPDYIKENKVAIVVAKDAIVWHGDDKADIVAFPIFNIEKPEEKEKILTFYKQFIRLINSKEEIEKIKRYKNKLDLYRYLVS